MFNYYRNAERECYVQGGIFVALPLFSLLGIMY